MKHSVARWLTVIGVVTVLLGSFTAARASVPLSAEALTKEAELYPYEGILPSPDGTWIAYEASDPLKPMRYEYEGQRFTNTGFPMLAGASACSVWVTEVSTGKSIKMASPQGSSWSPSWSPDGKRLAFYSDRSGHANLWVWDRATGVTRQIGQPEIYFSWWRERPLWSKDGKTILTKLVPEGMTIPQVLSLAPFYSRLLNKDKPQEADPNKATVKVYSFHPTDKPKQLTDQPPPPPDMSPFFDAIYLSDLATVDVNTGKVTRLIKRVRPMWFEYSPDQSQIAYVSVEGVVPKTQQNVFKIKVYSFADGQTVDVATGYMDPNVLGAGVSWSPDGTRIAYCDTGKTAERAAYVVNVKARSRAKISDGLDKSSRAFTWGAPLWNSAGTKLYLLDPESGRLWEVGADGSNPRELMKVQGAKIKDIAEEEGTGTFWSPDANRTMYVTTHDDDSKRDAIYAIGLQDGNIKKVYEGDESISRRESGALTGMSHSNALVYTSQSAMRAEDVWTLDVQTGERRRLSNLNPQFEEASMGQVRTIDFYSLRGEHLHAALLLPGDFQEGRRYPTVVWIYGGDTGSDKVNRFGFGWGGAFNPQMWASRGYAVLYPDIPLHDGTPVDDLVSAVIPAINRSVELGVSDAQRLAVMGQSFGGYNTIALLTRTDIFKAAVATSAAATDLYEGYSFFMDGTAPCEGYYEEGQGSMKGNPWEFKTRYWENSPFFFLEKVKTPLMIQRGTTDKISIQSGNVYNALRRLGKDVELLEYEYENHVVQQPINVVDFWDRRIAWLEKYLAPVPSQDTSQAASH